MEPINIKETFKTPLIISDPVNGIIEIKGRSNPENSVVFYRPLFNWIEMYSKEPNKTTTLNIHLEHFNTGSSKCILEVLKRLEFIQKTNLDVTVNWYYDKNDEDILEAGENYEAMTTVPFKMIAV